MSVDEALNVLDTGKLISPTGKLKHVTDLKTLNVNEAAEKLALDKRSVSALEARVDLIVSTKEVSPLKKVDKIPGRSGGGSEATLRSHTPVEVHDIKQLTKP